MFLKKHIKIYNFYIIYSKIFMVIHMNYNISNECKKILRDKNIEFEVAKEEQLNEILKIYQERMNWFKEKGINQWTRYKEHHSKEEFKDIIKRKRLFILKQNKDIISAFQIEENSKYWEDNKKAYYLYKVVTLPKTRKIGDIIVEICKDLAIANNKMYLRLDCLEKNRKLNKIYVKHGFNLVKKGHDKSYYYTLREYKI